MARLTLTDDDITLVSFSADSSRIATVGRAGAAALWDRDAKRLVSWETGAVKAIVFGPEDGQTAIIRTEGTVLLSGADTQDETLSHTRPISKVTFSPDGSMVATAGDDGTVTVWQADGTRLASFRQDGAIGAMTFLANGSLATSTADELWFTAVRPLDEMINDLEQRLGTRAFTAAECQQFNIDVTEACR